MDFIKAKECILNRAKELRACSDQYKKALKAENYDELKQVINDNLSWCYENKLLSDQESLEHFGVVFLNLLNSGNDNTGYGNSGYGNSGDWNSGSRNSGDWNSGSRNSGYGNSGDWNSGDGNNGFFNSVVPDTILVFNKPCKKSDWENAEKPGFIYELNTTKWIWFSDMTDEEKKIHSKAYVCDGYLKVFSYKEAWKNAFDTASEHDKSLLRSLPNFDSSVFEEITGIKLD